MEALKPVSFLRSHPIRQWVDLTVNIWVTVPREECLHYALGVTGWLSPALYKDVAGLGSPGTVERLQGRDDSRESRTGPEQSSVSTTGRPVPSGSELLYPEVCRTVCQPLFVF